MNDAATEVPPVHYTTSQLVKMVMDKTGMPCRSRNRSALLKKLGLPAEKADPAKNPVKAKKEPTVRQKAKARAKAGVKAAKDKRAAKKAKPAKAKPTTIRSDATLHAKALAAVKSAMSRKEPPSLRALCAEFTERGIEKPRGGTDWRPSSVQSLMRQAGYAAGGLPGKE